MKGRMAWRYSQMMDQSQGASSLRAPLMVQDLSAAQRSLVDLMHVHQFGRIENILVRAGEPILNSDVQVVRVARLGGGSEAAKVTNAEEFELKRQVRDLFEELEHLQDGTVIRLEFRHGLPFLLETTQPLSKGVEPPPADFVRKTPKGSSPEQADVCCVKGNWRGWSVFIYPTKRR
jgi:hypothetical protein